MGLDVSTPFPREEIINLSPSSGGTVGFNANGNDQTMLISPAGNLDALTVTIPSDSLTRNGQILTLLSTKDVTTLTVTSSGASIINAPAGLVANTPIQYKKAGANTWIALGGIAG